MNTKNVNQYALSIAERHRGGKATEYTYRSDLEELLRTFGKELRISSDPKRIECGAPDILIEKRDVPLGYIETKTPTTAIGTTLRSKQIKRYKESLGNLIVTNYIDFAWIISGELFTTVSIGKARDELIELKEESYSSLVKLFESFIDREEKTICSSKELAIRLARKARLICDITEKALAKEYVDASSYLTRQYEGIKEFLLPNITEKEFADIYAQTMVYGLFTARISAKEDVGAQFDRYTAYRFLKTSNFLKKLFLDIGEAPEATVLSPFISDICHLLARSDSKKIREEFQRSPAENDPVIYFYETFLAEYDPKTRHLRGVFYTPKPVVGFIIASINQILSKRLEITDGLASESVCILDPATGTGTFILEILESLHRLLLDTGQLALWTDFVRNNLKPRLYGFELLVASYSIAHLKLQLYLDESGYKWNSSETLNIFLTNTLDEPSLRKETLGNLSWYISEEANQASVIKQEKKIHVICGNPPYSNFGKQNKSRWIRDLLKDYKAGLNEKKINLDDDYIKFIRFAQWKMSHVESGLTAYVTNSSFISGITHRKMRKSLIESFDEIYILNLHGSLLRKQSDSRYSEDENVFDIQQGVCIVFLVKGTPRSGRDGALFYAEMIGKRDDKYHSLETGSWLDTEWEKVEPVSPYYFFEPHTNDGADAKRLRYDSFIPLTDMFNVASSGIQTKRDELFVDFDKESLAIRMKRLLGTDNIQSLATEYPLDPSSGWTASKLEGISFSENNIRPYWYRPFDLRWIYYDQRVLGRARYECMSNMLEANKAISTLRQTVDDAFRHVFIVDGLCDMNLVIGHHVSDRVFPLYLYPENRSGQSSLFAERQVNISKEIIKEYELALGAKYEMSSESPEELCPETIFSYVVAILNSPKYRTLFFSSLRHEIPKIPIPECFDTFKKLALHGSRMVSIYRLSGIGLNNLKTHYPVSGNNCVERVALLGDRLYINDEQYFENIPAKMYEQKLGGYTVLQKWLKDRKGHTLTFAEIVHFQKIIVALQELEKEATDIDDILDFE